MAKQPFEIRWHMRELGIGFWRLLWWRLTGQAKWRTYFWDEAA